jgi:hypothetical protein
MSVIDTWHPVTKDFGVIEAPLAMVLEGLLDWHACIGIRYRRREIDGGLGAALEALLPLCHAKQRKLLTSTASQWTAFFQNGIDGSDPTPVMSLLARKLEVTAMRICSTPPSAMWPATIWEVYASGYEPLGYRRSVCVSNDGGKWVFYQSGEPFAFEEVEAYDRKRKRDRFTRELLLKYLSHFQLRPFDDDFYRIERSQPAILLDNGAGHGLPEFTLEEAVAGVPWQRKT